jgi:hypothetical protein
LVAHGSVERIQEQDIHGSVGGSRGVIGENARGEFGYGRKPGGFCGSKSRMFLEVIDGLLGVAFREREVGKFETMNWLVVVVGDDNIDHNKLGA